MQEGGARPLELSVEESPAGHPAINGELLVEHARVALSLAHRSPAVFEVRHPAEVGHPTQVAFGMPDPCSVRTCEREDFVEKGAIVLAGLLLQQFASLRITRVMDRGNRLDYYLGTVEGDDEAVLEVGGTMGRRVETVLEEIRRQMEASPFRKGLFKRPGVVAVTRFRGPAVSILEVMR